MPADGAPAYHHHEQAVLLTVGHDGCIAKACGHNVGVTALAIGNEELIAPGIAIVL